MIIINVKSCSVKTLKETYYKAVEFWHGTCPICQTLYQHHGSYPRKTPHSYGPSFIKRVYCKNCKISHALIPCYIIPYSRVMSEIKEFAISGISLGSYTIEELAELANVEPTTISRWWRIFCAKLDVMTDALMKKLAQSPQLTYWLSGPVATYHQQARKVLELMFKCRATFFQEFQFCRFAWVNLFDPYLLFMRKGLPDTNPDAFSAG